MLLLLSLLISKAAGRADSARPDKAAGVPNSAEHPGKRIRRGESLYQAVSMVRKFFYYHLEESEFSEVFR